MAALLLLSCSARKLPNRQLLPAIERYDGPIYRVLRRHRRETGTLPRLLILSAAFGLIEPDWIIPDYDQKLDDTLAAKWKLCHDDRLRFQAAYLAANEVFAVAGGRYLSVFDAWLPRHHPLRPPMKSADGGIGRKLGQLKSWLAG